MDSASGCGTCRNFKVRKQAKILNPPSNVPNLYIDSCKQILTKYEYPEHIKDNIYWSEEAFKSRVSYKQHDDICSQDVQQQLADEKYHIHNHMSGTYLEHQSWKRKCQGCRELNHLCYLCLSSLKTTATFINNLICKYDA